MRKLVPLIVVLFAVSAFGQDSHPTETSRSVNANWSKMGPTVEGPRGFTLFSRGIRLNQKTQHELWVKIVPTTASAFVRRYDLPKNTSYVMQYATVDCAKNVLLLEKTTMYDAADQLLTGNTATITPSSKRSSVKPGSIGETLFRFVCTEPATPPMPTEQPMF